MNPYWGLREIAELHLYDGDTDRPLPGYQAAHDLADRLDGTVCVRLVAEIELSAREIAAKLNGAGK